MELPGEDETDEDAEFEIIDEETTDELVLEALALELELELIDF